MSPERTPRCAPYARSLTGSAQHWARGGARYKSASRECNWGGTRRLRGRKGRLRAEREVGGSVHAGEAGVMQGHVPCI
eukprot:717244-Prorocentrum_minimum.AAC.3